MDADGSHQVNLTDNPAIDADPLFSPDGEHDRVRSDRGGN